MLGTGPSKMISPALVLDQPVMLSEDILDSSAKPLWGILTFLLSKLRAGSWPEDAHQAESSSPKRRGAFMFRTSVTMPAVWRHTAAFDFGSSHRGTMPEGPASPPELPVLPDQLASKLDALLPWHWRSPASVSRDTRRSGVSSRIAVSLKCKYKE